MFKNLVHNFFAKLCLTSDFKIKSKLWPPSDLSARKEEIHTLNGGASSPARIAHVSRCADKAVLRDEERRWRSSMHAAEAPSPVHY